MLASKRAYKETKMHRSAYAIAAVAIAALFASAPANAEYHYGPVKNGNQCWKSARDNGNTAFGYWDQCPAPAATTAAAVRHHRRHHS